MPTLKPSPFFPPRPVPPPAPLPIVPVAVVLTKCDLAGPARLEAVLGEVRSLLALAVPGLRPGASAAGERDREVSAGRERLCVCVCVRACGKRRRRSDFIVRLEATGPIGLRILYLMHDNAYSSSYSCWVLYA
jgi:hypothetical protein